MTKRTYIIGLITTISTVLFIVFFPPTIHTSVLVVLKMLIAGSFSGAFLSAIMVAMLVAFFAALIGIIATIYDATVEKVAPIAPAKIDLIQYVLDRGDRKKAALLTVIEDILSSSLNTFEEVQTALEKIS